MISSGEPNSATSRRISGCVKGSMKLRLALLGARVRVSTARLLPAAGPPKRGEL
jgi:hypothetical protein